MTFNQDPNLNKRKIDRFIKLCEECELPNSKILAKCYENKITLGCQYPKEIENVINQFDKVIEKHEGPPNWVDLID